MASHLLKVQTLPRCLYFFSFSPYKSHQPQELFISVTTRWRAMSGLWLLIRDMARWCRWAAAKFKGHVVAANGHGQLGNRWNKQKGTLKGRRDVFKVEPTHAGNAPERSHPACMRWHILPNLYSYPWPRAQTACWKVNSGLSPEEVGWAGENWSLFWQMKFHVSSENTPEESEQINVRSPATVTQVVRSRPRKNSASHENN